MPNSISKINDGIFSDCRLLSVSIPNTVNSIGKLAFSACNIVFCPNSVLEIETDAFNCVGNVIYYGSASGKPWGAFCINGIMEGDLVFSDSTKTVVKACNHAAIKVTIPNSVVLIDQAAFHNCRDITSIILGNSVKSIGDYAFYLYCSNLTEIISLNRIAPKVGIDAFGYVKSTIPIHIPCGSMMSYESSWSYFSNFIEKTNYVFSFLSSDTTMGTVDVFTYPTCNNPKALISAVVKWGYRFKSWSDGDTNNPRTITLTQDTVIFALFEKTDYIVSLASNNKQWGSVTGDGIYPYL